MATSADGELALQFVSAQQRIEATN